MTTPNDIMIRALTEGIRNALQESGLPEDLTEGVAPKLRHKDTLHSLQGNILEDFLVVVEDLLPRELLDGDSDIEEIGPIKVRPMMHDKWAVEVESGGALTMVTAWIEDNRVMVDLAWEWSPNPMGLKTFTIDGSESLRKAAHKVVAYITHRWETDK